MQRAGESDGKQTHSLALLGVLLGIVQRAQSSWSI